MLLHADPQTDSLSTVTKTVTATAQTNGTESILKRLIFTGIMWVLTGAFFYSAMMYWAPSHSGTDQNGYLVGAKQFAYTLSMAQRPSELSNPGKFDPHQVIGRMWVVSNSDRTMFFPKYPLGMPLLVAICIWIWGLDLGTWCAYLVSPVAMALTLPAVYFMIRRFAGSFSAILGMLIFATGPTTSWVMNNPNSHATCVFCVVWGLWLSIKYTESRHIIYGILGGFLTGYACTIRYTEGLLILPLAWLALMGMRNWSLRECGRMLVLPIAWAVPVVALFAFNYIQIGTLTGYDATNESVGFAWAYFYDNWETILRAMNNGGLFLIFPISVAGMVAMFWWDWRWGMFFLLWSAPTLGLYTFYYWAPDGEIAVGYLRFLFTILPPMLVSGFWLIMHTRDFLHEHPPRLPGWAIGGVMILIGAVVAVAGHYALRWDFGTIERRLIPTDEFLGRIEMPQKYLQEATVFYGCLLSLTIFATVAAGSIFLRKRIVPTLIAGVVAALSGAVQLDNSTRLAERDAYERNVLRANIDVTRRFCPDGSIIITREDGFAGCLQFVGDYRIYQGHSFDRNWVNNQPRDNLTKAELIDPVRNQALFDALVGQDQKAMEESARRLVREAWDNHRRVFMIDSLRPEDVQRWRKDKQPIPSPEFIRRYLGNGNNFSASRASIWNIPAPFPNEDRRPGYRGRRGDRPGYRNSYMQIWEVTRPS